MTNLIVISTSAVTTITNANGYVQTQMITVTPTWMFYGAIFLVLAFAFVIVIGRKHSE